MWGQEAMQLGELVQKQSEGKTCPSPQNLVLVLAGVGLLPPEPACPGEHSPVTRTSATLVQHLEFLFMKTNHSQHLCPSQWCALTPKPLPTSQGCTALVPPHPNKESCFTENRLQRRLFLPHSRQRRDPACTHPP